MTSYDKAINMAERKDPNKLKGAILAYLEANSSVAALDISMDLGEEYHNISNALLRLRRSQLVNREKVRGGPRNRLRWEYTTKPKGLERLAYYREAGLIK